MERNGLSSNSKHLINSYVQNETPNCVILKLTTINDLSQIKADISKMSFSDESVENNNILLFISKPIGLLPV